MPYNYDLYLRLTVRDDIGNQSVAFHTTYINDGDNCIKCIYGDIAETETSDPSFISSDVVVSLYPNPTEGKTTLGFYLEEASFVKVQVADFTGILINEINSGGQEPGNQQYEIDLSAFKNG